MKKITELESFKINIINLAKHHKEHCTSDNCGVSLSQLRKMAEKLGIIFTEHEKRIFM